MILNTWYLILKNENNILLLRKDQKLVVEDEFDEQNIHTLMDMKK